MYLRRLTRLAVAGAALAAGIAYAVPASASVTYDQKLKTGFVGQADVRNAFGWTAATLRSRAAGVVFRHDFWVEDAYSAACGSHVFPVVHHREGGHFELADSVVYDPKRDAVTGFRLAGPRSGISGISQPPMVGQPCPEDQGQAPGAVIDKVRLVSSTAGWALTVRSGQADCKLLGGETPSR